MAQPKDKMSEIDDHIARRFDIQKRLGKGAYGIVWKAVDRKTKDIVAVKKIFDAFRNQTDAQRTFREIMFLQAFKHHPNIVRLHSIHRAANNRDIYLGFEYMETDLHNVIKRGNILKDIHKRYIMYQMLKATKYIHSGNVIHRDQKPSNVLLDSLCRCKIADFGLARSLTQISDGSPSDTDPALTDYVATRWYRAPEILIANRRYTKGIDMWSLGCILGEMLAGKPIFPGSSTVNQVEKIMATIPTPTSEDINNVCVSGVGSSMIKNAATLQRVPLKSILGQDVADDAYDLINKLLLFNPMKRLTAEQALEHEYVSRFHDPDEEIVLNSSVIIPLNDDVRLTVDDYRNKLYELMTSHHARSIKANIAKRTPVNRTSIPDVRPKVTKDTERYLKTHHHPKERSLNTLSEPKMTIKKSTHHHAIDNIRSDTKLSKQIVHLDSRFCRASGDTNKLNGSLQHEAKNKEKPKKKIISKSNVCTAFNSYHPSHGIITQSALMELRAAGMR